MNLYYTFFEISMAGVHWVYLPEILTDQQFGVVLTCHYMNGVELSLVTEYMIEYLKPMGLFLWYCATNFLGTFYMIFIVKETANLTDKQKKELYMPHHLKDKPTEATEESFPTPQDDLDISVEALED